jgi:hypothetical protein
MLSSALSDKTEVTQIEKKEKNWPKAKKLRTTRRVFNLRATAWVPQKACRTKNADQHKTELIEERAAPPIITKSRS